MKSFIKTVAALSIGALSLLIIDTGTSFAQGRGRGGGGGFRGGFHGGGGFGGPRFGFGGGFGYRPYYGGFGFRYGYPSIGLSFGYLPYGYFPFYYGSDLYYAYNGVYYRQNDSNYEVVAAPVGAEVPKLPSKAKSIMINNEQYFELNGVYYQEIVKPDGKKAYVIAGKDGVLNTGQPQGMPRVGDTFDKLPENSRLVTIAGKTYYVTADDVYLEESVDNGGTTSYRVVGVPEDPHGNQQPAPYNQHQDN